MQTTATRARRRLRAARAEELDLERRRRRATTSSSRRWRRERGRRASPPSSSRRTTPGLSFGAPMRKMGQRAIVNAEMFLEDVLRAGRPPARRRGAGLLRADATRSTRSRIVLGAAAAGLARAALEYAIEYAKERTQFGKPIAEHQAVAFRLADMARRGRRGAAARLARRRKLDAGEAAPIEAAMAKLVRLRDGHVVHVGRGADARRLGLLARVPGREVDAGRQARGDRGGHLRHPAPDHLPAPAGRDEPHRRPATPGAISRRSSSPRSVAVLGASNDPAKWGHGLAQGALRGEHRRPVYLVNRNGGEILGQPAYRSLAELPGPGRARRRRRSGSRFRGRGR